MRSWIWTSRTLLAYACLYTLAVDVREARAEFGRRSSSINRGLLVRQGEPIPGTANLRKIGNNEFVIGNNGNLNILEQRADGSQQELRLSRGCFFSFRNCFLEGRRGLRPEQRTLEDFATFAAQN